MPQRRTLRTIRPYMMERRLLLKDGPGTLPPVPIIVSGLMGLDFPSG
jgi:hypothetical protein